LAKNTIWWGIWYAYFALHRLSLFSFIYQALLLSEKPKMRKIIRVIKAALWCLFLTFIMYACFLQIFPFGLDTGIGKLIFGICIYSGVRFFIRILKGKEDF
jgi:hypothetical protein